MTKKQPRSALPRKEVDYKIDVLEMKKLLKELREVVSLLNGLLAAHTKKQDSVDELAVTRCSC